MNKVDVLHVRLTDLHAAHQNLPFPPDRTLPLKQYQYQGHDLQNILRKILSLSYVFPKFILSLS